MKNDSAMTLFEVENILRPTGGKHMIQKIVRGVQMGEFEITDLYQLAFHNEHKVAFHAAWCIEKLVVQDFFFVYPILQSLLYDYPKIKNASVRRSFTKIISMVVEKRYKKRLETQAQQLILTINWDPIVDALFKILLNEKEKVAVKMWCIVSLAYFSYDYDWISEELQFQVAAQLISPGMLSVNRKMKKILNERF